MKYIPRVSVLIPVRNEEDYIEECLNSVIANDYPSEKMEVLVIDGQSNDGTRRVVREYAEGKAVDVKLLDNPGRIVPKALNIGLEEASGEIIFLVGGHSYVEEDYIKTSVETLLDREDVDAAGGPVLPEVGETSSYFQRATALALSSRIASGSSRFKAKEDYVTTVSFGAYRKEVFQKYGNFDEDFIRTQDFEFNYRINRSGGEIFMNPEIKSYYFPRSSLKGLWQQYFQYGFWKKKVTEKYNSLIPRGNLVPPLFLVAIIAGIFAAIFSRLGVYAVLSIIGSYLILVIGGSIQKANEQGWKYLPILPVLLATIHVGFGAGFLLSFFLNKNFRPKLFHGLLDCF